ncbi:potassium-transporting ATPase subunit KdpC [Paenibacillus campi]|uniref:potassium-transporting ATPase subunit KdpC n=1 Tax=Paenibacillus campi TaxID=3106031 RepID=UPI002AFF9352|nr:potassium-transporting ATPase subunit KdpC [Paenibacillus sp. SGZ-1014]
MPIKIIWTTLRTSAVLFIVCCVIYQLAITGIAKVLMPYQASGSLMYNSKHEVIGSALIGQQFTEPQFFQGRVSSIDYNADGSGSSNLAPSNPELIKRMQASIAQWKQQNPNVPVSALPMDLITNSASGLDPDISPAAALAQVPRISKLTGIAEDKLDALITQYTNPPQLGMLGDAAVNVLKLNIGLQQLRAGASS